MPESVMTDEQYLETQRRLLRYSYELSQLDLGAFIRRVAQAEAVGPVVDQTAYRHAAPALRRIRLIAEEARDLQNTFHNGQDALVGALADAFVERAPGAEGTRHGEGPGEPCARGSI